jgi:NADH:ubiquinone oxidoreductase subunit F (NADH-binding)
VSHAAYLLPSAPIESVVDYRARGGGDGLARALEIGPAATVSEVSAARLRGRGGGGFPTGIKWAGIADVPDQRRFVVCNAAEGEPGTFKDRALLRTNPYQVLEGIAIAAFATGAEEAYVGIKEGYRREIARLETAATEMAGAGILGEVPIRVVTGPDDYLLGEEKGMLEAIEGRQPLPRWYPPYLIGLHTDMPSGVGAGTSGWDTRSNPTAVNNVETLANVAPILARGADWFRSVGTADSPGAMVFTVSGDVVTETVVELPMGTPLAVLVHGYGGGLGAGRQVRAVFPGASNAPVPDSLLDTPMDFASMSSIGSGLGSGGMIVYDDTACVVRAALLLSRFLAIESCGQCPPCKLGTDALADRFLELESGSADVSTLDQMDAWIGRVTDANRCGLGAGERALSAGMLRFFTDDVVAHLGRACPWPRDLTLPKMTDWDPETGTFTHDVAYFAWRNP